MFYVEDKRGIILNVAITASFYICPFCCFCFFFLCSFKDPKFNLQCQGNNDIFCLSRWNVKCLYIDRPIFQLLLQLCLLRKCIYSWSRSSGSSFSVLSAAAAGDSEKSPLTAAHCRWTLFLSPPLASIYRLARKRQSCNYSFFFFCWCCRRW